MKRFLLSLSGVHRRFIATESGRGPVMAPD